MANVAAPVYGGDEVGAIVMDPGSSTTKAGFAGEESPRFVIPSYYGYNNDLKKESESNEFIDYKTINYKEQYKRKSYTYFGDELIHYPRNNTDIKSFIKDEVIEDWDAAIEMFDFLFKSLDINVEEQPTFLTEPIWNSKSNKLKSLEIFLEFFQTPGFYMAKTPACTSFAVGRPNSLIVDIGHHITSVTPVLDGMCLSKNTMKTHYAGLFLDTQLKYALNQRLVEIIPSYKIKNKSPTKYSLQDYYKIQKNPKEISLIKPNFKTKSNLPNSITKSFEDFEKKRIFNEMKQGLIVVPETPISDSNKFDYQSRYFELPNGLQVEFESERYDIANSLFEPEKFIEEWSTHEDFIEEEKLNKNEFVHDWSKIENGELGLLEINNEYVPLKRGKKKEEVEDDSDINNDNSKNPVKISSASKDAKIAGLSSLINKTIFNIDVDVRQQVAYNIVVTGSTSLIPGLTDRLNKDLTETNPGLKIRIHSSGNSYDRGYESWTGGSILSSLGIFHQLWVSKREYEEVGGDRLIVERFR